ncbi:MAG TPA: DUF2934 domain-containing protein [Steroidobacteraceae bacterium]|nr:DUF2934 domain-containing protein [Steroidobacteraceae bacterium]
MATRRTSSSTGANEAGQSAQKAPPRQRAPASKPDGAGTAATATASSGTAPGITVTKETRRVMIEQAAYLRAERRGFPSGGEVEDWLAAEAEVDALLRAGNSGPPQ